MFLTDDSEDRVVLLLRPEYCQLHPLAHALRRSGGELVVLGLKNSLNLIICNWSNFYFKEMSQSGSSWSSPPFLPPPPGTGNEARKKLKNLFIRENVV